MNFIQGEMNREMHNPLAYSTQPNKVDTGHHRLETFTIGYAEDVLASIIGGQRKEPHYWEIMG